jgi:hypothetical protein
MVNKTNVVALFPPPEEAEYPGYDYLEIDSALSPSYLLEFQKGIVALYKKQLFLLRERKAKITDVRKEIRKEIRLFQKKTDSYYTYNIDAGLTDLRVLDFYLNVGFYMDMIEGLKNFKNPQFTKKDLAGIIEEADTGYVEAAPIEYYLNKRTEQSIQDNIDDDLSDFVTGAIMKLIDNCYSPRITELTTKLFDECRVSESGTAYQKEIIKFNIRNQDEVHCDDKERAAEFAALCLLKYGMMDKATRQGESSLRKEFLEYRIVSLRDEFRYQFARKISWLNEIIATKKILLDLEVNDFASQYISLYDNKRKEFDMRAKIFLIQVARSHNMNVPWGLY